METAQAAEAFARWKRLAPRRFSIVQPRAIQLLRVAHSHGAEYVAGNEYGDYQGAKFDPWAKGDLLVVCCITRAHYQKGSPTTHEAWRIAYRDSTPSTVRAAYRLNAEGTFRWYSHDNVVLYRVPYRWRQAAAQLFGRDFESREAVELAFDNPNAMEIAA